MWERMCSRNSWNWVTELRRGERNEFKELLRRTFVGLFIGYHKDVFFFLRERQGAIERF